MKVCIIGGIFDKPAEYRASHRLTPETILAEGLTSRGVSVTTAGHAERVDLSPFDIVHVHHLGVGALRAVLVPTAGVVYTNHRPFIGLPSWRTRLVGVDFLQPTVSDLRAGAATRLIMRCADIAVALSEREADVHRRLYHVPPKSQAIIPNGIPASTFAAASRELAEPPELLYIGQLVPFKQVDVLLRALAALPEPALLRLVHQVADLRPQLTLQARQLGIADRVCFEGPKKPEEIAVLLSRATALVLPSAMEALPSVITEAMLAGVPVVATRVGGITEQVGPNGYVVEPGSAVGLTEALSVTIRERARWLDRSEEIRASAVDRFSVDRMLDDHVSAYERVLSTPHRRRQERRAALWRRSAAVASRSQRR